MSRSTTSSRRDAPRHRTSGRRLLAMAILGSAVAFFPRVEVVWANEATFETRHPATVAAPAGAVATSTVAAAGLDDDAVAAAGETGRLAAAETLDREFLAIGVTLPANPTSPALVRVQDDGAWGPWLELEFNDDHGPDDPSEAGRPGSHSAPVWVGHAGAYELNLPGDAGAPEVHLAHQQQVRARLQVEVEPAGAAPFIVPRSSWGAREPSRQPVSADSFQFAVVHHSVSANDYGQGAVPGMLRSIQAYHMDVNGWSDIGYNFAVDRFGGIWEAHAGGVHRAVVGGHSRGFNTGSVGVVMLGEYGAVRPSAESVRAVASVVSWKFALHDVPPTGTVVHTTSGSTKYEPGTAVTLNRVVGHRDVSLTACPGGYLYDRLGEIRSLVSASYRGDLQVVPAYRLPANSGGDPWANDHGPSIQAVTPTRLEAARRGPRGDIQLRTYENATWSPWVSIGGVALSQPDLASWGNGRLDVLVVGLDGALWHRGGTRSSLTPWRRLGGILTSAPAAVSWGPGRIDVFARGVDGRLWSTRFDRTNWRDWRGTPSILSSAPAASARRPGVIDVFARGGDGAVHHMVWNGDGLLFPWESLGGFATAAPTSVITGGLDGTAVFARGLDGQLYWRAWFGTAWSPWQGLSGLMNSAPDATSRLAGTWDLLTRGTDGRIWARSWTGTGFTPYGPIPD